MTDTPDALAVATEAVHNLLCRFVNDHEQSIYCAVELDERVARAVLAAVEPVIRRAVAEEIAEDIEATVGGRPGRLPAKRPRNEQGLYVSDAQWAATIARSHGQEIGR